MDGFLALVVRGRGYAAIIAAACLLPPLTSIVSGAVIALVTLRFGLGEGAVVLAMTVAGAGGLSLGLFGDAQGVLAFAALLGVPVALLAAILRATQSQGLAVAAGGALGGLALAMLHLVTGDPTAWWRGVLETTVAERVRASGRQNDPEALERLGQVLDFFAPVMSLTLVWFIVGVLAVLFLGRWAQARLDNPGGFGREFRGLKMDRRVSYVTIAVAVLAYVAPQWAGGLAGVLLYLLIVLHGLQGVAIAHWFASARSLGGGWLAAMYVALVFVPLVIVPLAVTGLSDTWMDWRRRAGGAGPVGS